MFLHIVQKAKGIIFGASARKWCPLLFTHLKQFFAGAFRPSPSNILRSSLVNIHLDIHCETIVGSSWSMPEILSNVVFWVHEHTRFFKIISHFNLLCIPFSGDVKILNMPDITQLTRLAERALERWKSANLFLREPLESADIVLIAPSQPSH